MKKDYSIPLHKNNIYHIYNRGIGNEKIFYNKENYLYFLKQYGKYLSEFLDTFAFCLLPNHFHLLVRINYEEEDKVLSAFRKFFISYAMAINKEQNRHGSIFNAVSKEN